MAINGNNTGEIFNSRSQFFLKRAKHGMCPVGTVQLEANLGLVSQFPVSLSQHGSQIGKIGVSVIFHKSLDW